VVFLKDPDAEDIDEKDNVQIAHFNGRLNPEGLT